MVASLKGTQRAPEGMHSAHLWARARTLWTRTRTSEMQSRTLWARLSFRNRVPEMVPARGGSAKPPPLG